MTIDQFPASASKDFGDMTAQEQVALVGLGIRQFQQPGILE
jgi:hypothetical protein